MRTLLISVAALALAGAGLASAQEHEGHPAKPPMASGSSTPPMGPMASGSAMPMPMHDGAMMPTHEMCQSVMGRKMDPKQLHNHSADKGAPMAGMKRPLTKKQMAAMHTKCAAMMKADHAKN